MSDSTPSAGSLCAGLTEQAADYRSVQQSFGIQNCWFISAVAGLAYRRPDSIPKMLEKTDDKKYRVAFPKQSPVEVEVTENGAANFVEGEVLTDGFTNALEAAANALGWGAHTWRTITMGRGISLVTGNSYSFSTNLLFGFGSLWKSFHEKLEEAENEGKVVVIGTGLSRIKVHGLNGKHCYSLLSYDSKEKVATMRDPHCTMACIPEGRELPEHGPAAFWLTLDELQQNFMGMAIEK